MKLIQIFSSNKINYDGKKYKYASKHKIIIPITCISSRNINNSIIETSECKCSNSCIIEIIGNALVFSYKCKDPVKYDSSYKGIEKSKSHTLWYDPMTEKSIYEVKCYTENAHGYINYKCFSKYFSWIHIFYFRE